MLASFLKFSVVEVGARGLSWLTPAMLAVLLPPQQYGLIVLFIAVENLLLSVYILGLDKAVLRFGSDEEKRGGVIQACNRLWLLVSIPLSLAAFGIYFSLRQFGVIDSAIAPLHAAVLLVGIAFVALNRIHNAQMRVFGDARGFFYSRLFTQLARFILILAIVFLTDDALGYVYGTAACVVVVFWQVAKGHRYEIIDQIGGKAIAKFAWPYVPHMLSNSFRSYGDRLILPLYASLGDIGIYGFAYLAGSGITFIYGVMASYFEPYFYRDSSKEGKIDPVAYIAVQMFLGAVAGLIFIGFLSQTWLSLRYEGFEKLAVIILCAHLFHPIYLSGNYALARDGRTGLIAGGSVMACVLMMLLVIALAPRWGTHGAAVASFFGLGLLSIYMSWVSGLLKKRHDGVWIIMLWLLVMLMGLLSIFGMYIWMVLVSSLMCMVCLWVFYAYGVSRIRAG